MDPEDLLVIKQALEDSPRVDAERIDVIFAPEESAVMLVGAAGDFAEAAAAESIASQYADRVLNELRIDPWLREGIPHSGELEPTVPAEGEVLVGAPDMLAGPEPESMTDQLEGFSDNQPWDPPEQPMLPPTAAEWAARASMGDGDVPEDEPAGEADTEGVRRTDYAAPDLTREELAMGLRGARVPSLPPDTDPATLAVPDPTATERTEPAFADEEPGPELLPGATPG